jgi:hypothetical protein
MRSFRFVVVAFAILVAVAAAVNAILADCQQKCKNVPAAAADGAHCVGYYDPNFSWYECYQYDVDDCDECTGVGFTGWCIDPTGGLCEDQKKPARFKVTFDNCTLKCVPQIAKTIAQEAIITDNTKGTWSAGFSQHLCVIPKSS